MSIHNRCSFPGYFQIPSHDELSAQVGQLNPMDRTSLEGTIHALAVADGVSIEGWDTQWGQYHLLDSDERLIAALLDQIKAHVQIQSGCSSATACALMKQCPLVDRPMITLEVLGDLAQRARNLECLEGLKQALNNKYPSLKIWADDKAWKRQELFFLTLPVCMGAKEQQRFEYFTSVVQELISGNYSTIDAEMLLDRLLARESFHGISSSDLDSHLRLLELKHLTQRQIEDYSLSRGDESLCKDVFVVPSPLDKQGKFKPLPHCSSTKEEYAYRCDRILGIGMTAPTLKLRPSNFVQPLIRIHELFKSAALGQRQMLEVEEVECYRQCAYTLLNASALPFAVKDAIFGEMYFLCGQDRQSDDLGAKLMFHLNGEECSDFEKARAIQNYLHSYAFIEHVNKYAAQGTVQIWLNNCNGRAFEYIVKDQEGGAKLKTASKTVAHFYALLGILKGSMDCASGNTLVEFDEENQQVSNFWDMDDERSMPQANDFWHLRLWQMGLPQCALPFDRAFLLLFSDSAILEKLKRIQVCPEISSLGYSAQFQRLEKIITLCAEELKKQEITLTPRELFFALFPGSQYDFDTVKARYNEDKTYGEEGIRISPIELFEFQLPEMGRGSWYTGDEEEQRIIGNNMRELYSPELP